ncbi:hypothetical protein JCM3770_004049 [Rhodotorula araucariae]
MASATASALDELAALWSERDHLGTALQAAHLRLLVQQRTLALLQLERTTRQFAHAQRAELAALAEELKRAVENEVALEAAEAGGRGRTAARGAKGKGPSARLARERAEHAYVERYAAVLHEFDAGWAAGTRLFTRWDAVLPVERGKVSTWLDHIAAPNAGAAAQQTITALLKDPYVLGSGIATLDSLASLFSPAPSGLSSSASSPAFFAGSVAPFSTLLRFVHGSLGPQATLDLCLGALNTAVRELVGRESSAARFDLPTTGLGLGVGLGLGIEGQKDACEAPMGGRTTREKDLEEFVVSTLDALETLGGRIELQGSAQPSSSGAASLGPLAFESRGVENLLLSFLASATDLDRHAPVSPAPSSTLPLPPGSPARAPVFSTPSWSTLTSSFSALTSYPTAAVSTAVHVAAGAMPFGLPSPPLSQVATSPALDRHQTASSPTPLTPSPPSISAFLPYSPESASKPLPRTPVSPFSTLLSRTATSLLHLLAPSSTAGSASLPEALVSRLLSTSFPPKSAPAEHRKILVLTIVRWWAFGRLGRVLRHPSTGGAPAPSLPGVHIEASAVPLPRCVRKSASASPLLDEVFVPTAAELEHLVPLHREVYCALVDSCGAGARDPADEAPEEGNVKRELRAAAGAFLAAWTSPREPSVPPAHITRAAALAPAEFSALVDAFAPVVLPPSLSHLGLAPSPSVSAASRTSSFKRSPAFGAGVRAPCAAKEGPDAVESLLDRAEDIADRAALYAHRQRGAEELAVAYVSSGEAGSKPVVALEPPGHISPPLPKLDITSDLNESDLATVRHATCALLTGGDHAPANDLAASLAQASAISCAAKDYPSHALYAEACILLDRFPSLAPSVTEQLAAPLRAAHASSRASLALAQAQLASLDTQFSALGSLALTLLARSNALRIRGWHLSVTASPLGEQLRTRLRSALDPHRPVEDAERARSEIDEWRAELGVVDVLKVGEQGRVLDEALMLVEVTAALASESEALLAHPLFEREASVLAARAGAPARNAAATAKRLANSVLGAPAALWSSLPLPGPAVSSAEERGAHVRTPAGDLLVECVLSSSGAVPASLAEPTRIDPDAYFQQLSSTLSAYLLSDLSSPASIASRTSSRSAPLIMLRDDLGARVGSDGWIDDLASSASPLKRDEADAMPRVFAPGEAAPPGYVVELLERFALHPSPSKKIDALLDLELVLSTTSPSSKAEASPPGKVELAATLHSRKRSTSAVTLHSSYHSRDTSTASMHSPASPAKSTFSVQSLSSRSPSPAHTEPSLSGSFALRRRRRRPSLIPGSTAGGERGVILQVPLVPLDLVTPSSASSPTSTDELLNRLVVAILHFLSVPGPFGGHGIYLSLHLITSLLPSLFLSPSARAKSLSDTLIAALSIKQGALDGPGGVVERAWEAMSEGTEEAEALARRLCEIALREDSVAARDLAAALN